VVERLANRAARVVWREGMLLSPQHLQQWDRYVEQLVATRFRAAYPFDWGLTGLAIDRTALGNGRLQLEAASGVLPDGTPFAAPERDRLPGPREIRPHFGDKQDGLTVEIGLPKARPRRAQVGPAAEPGAPGPRFASALETLPDDVEGASERDIELADTNLCVLFPDEALGDHDHIPIAELTRTASGGFALKPAFIPPCLAIGASERLMQLLRTNLEKLRGKSSSLSDMRRQRGGVAEFSVGDSANFWLLHSVNSYIPTLAHMVRHRSAHPEEAYLALVSLAGQLCTISMDLFPHDLPEYDHGALGRTFADLDARLAPLLENVAPEVVIPIPLERKDELVSAGRLQDERLFEPKGALFVRARADVDGEELRRLLEKQMKIGAVDRIDFLIARARRGVEAAFVDDPPGPLPGKGNHLYFRIEREGEYWDEIAKAHNIAISTPPDVPGLKVELYGLRG
jgi:type VI secretion system protein ImpJ